MERIRSRSSLWKDLMFLPVLRSTFPRSAPWRKPSAILHNDQLPFFTDVRKERRCYPLHLELLYDDGFFWKYHETTIDHLLDLCDILGVLAVARHPQMPSSWSLLPNPIGKKKKFKMKKMILFDQEVFCRRSTYFHVNLKSVAKLFFYEKSTEIREYVFLKIVLLSGGYYFFLANLT